MNSVFIGTEALSAGLLTRHELRRWYRPIYRDVLVPKQDQPSLHDRAMGAWLWWRRQGIVAGLAASSMHGTAWVGDDVPIELIWRNSRPHRGLVVRDERIGEDEIVQVGGIPVTTPARTAFDIGRHLPPATAVARLDALARAQNLPVADVLQLAQRYQRARGVRRLKQSLGLVDAGAQSPKETWLRLLVVAEGLPKPTTQIPVDDDGYVVAYLDMGWARYKVALEYDGDHHRSDRRQYVKDIRRQAMLESLGWIVIRVVAEDTPVTIMRRVVEALRRRGYTEIDARQRVTRTFAA
jgi:very-short-patch-repair endonuclease